jgi:hypothetical protein
MRDLFMRLARCGVSVALVLLAACGDSDGPSDQLPQVGRYTYTYDGRGSDLDSIHFDGTLVLTLVSPDSMAGRWEVPGYNPPVLHGFRRPTSDSWFLMASSTDEGVASHDVFPGDGTLPVECEMTYNFGNGTRTFGQSARWSGNSRG